MTAEPSAQLLIIQDSKVPPNEKAFLNNRRNKQAFVYLLSDALENAGITVVHAIDEGDADVRIGKEALTLASSVNSIKLLQMTLIC